MEINQRNIDIKNYICSFFVKEDQDLLSIKKCASDVGLPKIAIPENVGKLLYILTKLQKPQRILEIGTLAGYSTAWLAKAAPEAKIITLECNSKHASIARTNFQNAHLSQIEVLEDDALKTLQFLIEQKEEPFDLIFLDADKEGYPNYFPYLLKLSKTGTMLLTDNLIPKETPVNNPSTKEIEAIKTYQYNSLLAECPHIETILVTNIVGEKGRIDALGVSLVTL